jgi:hypothetical protein
MEQADTLVRGRCNYKNIVLPPCESKRSKVATRVCQLPREQRALRDGKYVGERAKRPWSWLLQRWTKSE